MKFSIERSILMAIALVATLGCASAPSSQTTRQSAAQPSSQQSPSRGWYAYAGGDAAKPSAPSAESTPLASPGRVPPRVDPAAARLLSEVGATLSNATSLRAKTRTESYSYPFSHMPKSMRSGGGDTSARHDVQTSDVRYMRPNYVWMETAFSPEPGEKEPWSHNMTVCTPGKTVVYLGFQPFSYARNDSYRCYRAGDDAFAGFFDPKSERLTYMSEWDATGKTVTPMLRSLTLVGKETWNGVSYDVVEAVYGTAYQQPEDTVVMTRRIYISPERTIRRYVESDNYGNRSDHQVLSLELSAPLTANDFVWTPPDTMKIKPVPENPPSPLLGKEFPTLDVAAKFQDGRTSTLRQYLAGKKGAIVWYWATTCGGCIVEFPHFEQMYRAARTKGIEVIALDPMTDSALGDSVEENHAGLMRDFWRTTMPIVLSNAVTKGLTENSVTYMILDANGKIVDLSIGVDFRAVYQKIDALAEGRTASAAR